MSREKTEHQQRVEAFMAKAQQQVPDKPTMPTPEVRILRAKLIFEEAVRELIGEGLQVFIRLWDEKNQAYHVITDPSCVLVFIARGVEPDMVKIADGAADTSVVTTGTLSACGIADRAIQEAVDESNLAKFTVPTCPRCSRPMTYSNAERHWYCDHDAESGSVVLPANAGGYRSDGTDGNPAGKFIKPKDWKAPDIAGILEAQSKPETVEEAHNRATPRRLGNGG